MTDKDYFDIYAKNPNSCQMLVMKENGKIVARALVWKLHKISITGVDKPEYFMDRIYFIRDYQKNMMEKYANDKGWAYKSDSYSLTDILFNSNFYFDVNMVVKINPGEYLPYPYLDTFSRYDADNGLLYNDTNHGRKVRGHLLRMTEGGYSRSRFEPTILTKFKDWWNK